MLYEVFNPELSALPLFIRVLCILGWLQTCCVYLENGLKLLIHLPPPPECWDYNRHSNTKFMGC